MAALRVELPIDDATQRLFAGAELAVVAMAAASEAVGRLAKKRSCRSL